MYRIGILQRTDQSCTEECAQDGSPYDGHPVIAGNILCDVFALNYVISEGDGKGQAF